MPRPLTPHEPAQVLSHTGPSHFWGHTHTGTHRRGTMAICKVLASGLREGAGERRVRWGSWALSWFMLILIVRLANVSPENTTIPSPISANTHVLPRVQAARPAVVLPVPVFLRILKPLHPGAPRGRACSPQRGVPTKAHGSDTDMT